MQTVSCATISFDITTHGFLTRVYPSTQNISKLTAELIDELDCRFPDPRTDGLPTVRSAP